ncbi:MAG TPA: hypothetical protein PLD27_09940 [bacterium]|nr:hypothetical protein [bacterium]HOL48760.1 hypothetical protein [bacterium]HPQ19558.1 hypothetical protein [bacterium]
MNDEIIIEVIGDSGPFSAIGRSIGYLIRKGEVSYLLDCGAPVFQYLGFEGLKRVRGIIGTHSHEDHKRWFTDIALFKKYVPGSNQKLKLITSETIHEEFYNTSKAALEKSLSIDSRRIVDIPYSEFVDTVIIGPKAKYKIKKINGSYEVVNNKNEIVSKDKAKIFLNKLVQNPRLLFYDNKYHEWIEPESFYPFSDDYFYEKEKNIYYDKEIDLAIEAVKSISWHGLSSIAVKFSSNNNSILFSSDTCFNLELWENLYKTKYDVKTKLNSKEFKNNQIIYDNINNYIERIWSKERFEAAIKRYKEKNIIHDVAGINSIVHTDYPNLVSYKFNNLYLTHSPDNFVSVFPLLHYGKKYLLKNNKLYEIKDGLCFELNADIYFKSKDNYFVGYQNKNGKFNIVQNENKLLEIRKDLPDNVTLIFKVDLYLDIDGKYYKINSFDEISNFRIRPDKYIEYVKWNEKKSIGTIINNEREKISKSFLLR